MKKIEKKCMKNESGRRMYVCRKKGGKNDREKEKKRKGEGKEIIIKRRGGEKRSF